MKIPGAILILAFAALLDFKCAEGSEERTIQKINTRDDPSAPRGRGRPYARPPLARYFTKIEPQNSIRLDFSDKSAISGCLQSYGYTPYPSWIYTAEYGKIIVYVLMPDGSGWITELEKDDRFTQSENIPVPKSIQVFLLPTGTILYGKLRVFNRNQYRLYVPRLHEKTHIFVTMPNGVVFTGQFM